MKKTLKFNVSIQAPKQRVWKTMLDPGRTMRGTRGGHQPCGSITWRS